MLKFLVALFTLTTALAYATTAEDVLLRKSVKAIGGESGYSKTNGLLCSLSEDHVSYMIDEDAISHDGFGDRSNKITSSGGSGTGEIVAMNCQKSPRAAAASCARQWENSPGHHKLMHKTWSTACFRMKRSADGCHYCMGLFANGL